MLGMDEIPTQEEYKAALDGDEDLDKKCKLGDLNELAYEDFVLVINVSSSVGYLLAELGLSIYPATFD